MQTPDLDVRFLLGIDPGTETGLAAVSADDTRAVLFVGSAGPLATARRLEAWAADGRHVGGCLEDTRSLPVYARHRGAGRGERDRIARSVGAVDLLTTIYADLLASLGVPVALAPPVRAATWDAETAARLTGYAGRTNEHGRDALRHVYGRRFHALPTEGGGLTSDTAPTPCPETPAPTSPA